MSSFTPQREQDAWNTIRGFVYQVDLTIERWLNLQQGQTLELECGEDIDIVSRSLTVTPEERQRLLEQVKHRDSSITLKSPEAVTAIACFIDHRQTNPSVNLLFRFTTNTEVGKEKLSPMPNKAPAIVAWEQIRQGNLQGTAQNTALKGIRTILKNVKQPDKLHGDTWQIFCEFITNASDEQFLDLICSFEWSTKAPPAKSLSSSLQELLVDRKHARDNIEAQEQYRRLFLYVFKRLCERERKQLTLDELSSQLSLPTLSESDHQLLNNLLVWFHALEVRVQEHEVRLGVLEQRLDREKAEPYIGQEVADCVDNLLRDYTNLFVGRETILKQLDEFLTQTYTNLLTLIAPAGFGKTALLANWVASRKNNGCFVVYHFFSQRYDVTRSFSAAYRNLLRQLYDYYEPSDRHIPSDEQQLRDRLCDLIKEHSARDSKPLVIVLDALDEAEPPFSHSQLFLTLASLHENVFVIASARAEEGQEPEYLSAWTDSPQPPIRLKCLDDRAIAHWIRQAGEGELAGFAEDTHFVTQLEEITRGFPLYLHFLTDELIKAKPGDVQAVLTRSPKGFGAYVREQFKLLAKVKELRQRKVQLLFALLSVALGAFSEDEIREITKLNEWDLAALPWQVTRWFSVQTGFYSFAHPLLAKEFQGVLPSQSSSAKEKLIKYCSRWQKHQSHYYALRHYAEHLREEKQWEKLYAITRDEDFASAQRQHLPDEPDLPLKTVQTALLGGAEEDKAERMAKFLLVHAHRLGQTNAQQSPLEALRSSSLNRALKLAEQFEIERYILWYLLLVWELKDEDKLKEAREILEKLEQKDLPRFQTNWDTRWQGEYAAYFLAYIFIVNEDICTALVQKLLDDYHHCYLCHILSKHGDSNVLEKIARTRTEAKSFILPMLQTAEEIQNSPEQPSDLLLRAYAYAKAKNFSTLLKITGEGINSLTQIETLGFIAKALAEEGNSQTARATFATALQIANESEPSFLQALALAKLAEVQAKVEPKESGAGTARIAHQIAQTINNPSQKAIAIARIAEVLAQAGKGKETEALFDTAIDIAQTINSQDERVNSFTVVAEAQVRVNKFADALNTAQKIEFPCRKAKVLAVIAKAQAEAEPGEEFQTTLTAAIEVAQGIPLEGEGIEVLIAIAEAQSVRDKEMGLSTLTNLLEVAQASRERAKHLSKIAAAQAKLGEITTALTTADKIEDELELVKALSWIALAQFKKGKKQELSKTLTTALQAKEKIEDKQKLMQALKAIAGIQAMAGKGEEAVRTAETILTERNLYLPGVASWLLETGDRANFKKLLIPCAYYLDAAYQMCGLLARLYPDPEKVEAVAKVVSELN